MKSGRFQRSMGILCILVFFPSLCTLAEAQVTVVNMTPTAQSNEVNNDAEPNIAVNPVNANEIAATAFTPCPTAGTNAPIYVSTDGGSHWTLNCIVPGGNATFGTGDITVRFAGSGGVLYAGDLRGDSFLVMNILRTNNFTAMTPMTVLLTRASEDQPYIQATTVLAGASRDRVYLGNNNLSGAQSATVDLSLDAATAPAPAGFGPHVTETRATCGQDGPPTRPAVHANGTVYAAFFHWISGATGCGPGITTITADVVVVRDDNWGSGASPFAALQDLPNPPGDGLVGRRIATSIPLRWRADFGSQITLSSQISIAVDPNDSRVVWVAWADGANADASNYTIHVRRSTDSGANWSADLKTVVSATNPALAINSSSKVALLYQRFVNPGTCAGGGSCWETHLERTTDGTTWPDLVLANVSAAPHTGTHRDIGDYDHVVSVGKDFYGVFSTDNTPNMTNFPNSVTYLRHADFATHQLFADAAHTTPVVTSIDPFFFKSVEPAPTTLKYQGDTTADYHDPANLAATLTDQTNGLPIANASVQFTLGLQSCTATTNAAGLASCTLVLDQCSGSYTVKANFAGSALYLPSSDSKPFTVTPEETTLSYTGDTAIANGGTATLSGVLLEDNTTPVAGRTVTFTLGSGGSAQTCSGVTNASGIAACTISPVAQPLGPGVVTDTFAGDSCYRPASAGANTLLFAFPASGAFVVGDQSAQMGAKVTFWGAKWSKVNSLSGGAAPASFKGFAATLSAEPPKCGITWTTGPGNSSNPPATVPAYMGVLVATKVTKSGSTISGDAKSIVVVKTDPGYAPDPGHAGTGTVMAVFCHP